MIYLDSSVVLARVFAEPQSPTAVFWRQSFVSSRLLEYEVVNRVLARSANAKQLRQAEQLLRGFSLLDLSRQTLARALQSFPTPVRTLDGLHLATMDFLRAQNQPIELATYDRRLAIAATAMGFALAPL